MNKQKFIECLRQPDSLDTKNIQELEKLTKEYPYFQSARTLLAKAAKINKSKLARKYISTAALYATDRILLKRYLNDQLIFLNPLNVHESHEATYDRDRQAEIKEVKTTSIQSKLKSNPHVRLKSKGSQASAAPPRPKPEARKSPTPPAAPPRKREITGDDYLAELSSSSPSSLDQLINELYRDMKELKLNRQKFMEREQHLEEEEAVDEALKKATTKSYTRKASKTEGSKKKAEQKLKEEKKGAPEKPASDSARKTPESRSVRSKADTSPARPEPAKKTTSAKKTATTKKAAAAKKVSGTTGKSESSKPKPGSKSEKSGDKADEGDPVKSRQDELISNFIKTNPSISPGNIKRKNEVDLSNDSTVFHSDVASEYLAEIYLGQGKKERAIQIYEALLVKFPEKSVYFADVIKKLKE